MNLILSIKPKFYNKIQEGEKKVEFRKVIFKKDVNKIYIYVSAPIKLIKGYFIIEQVYSGSPIEIWEKFQKIGGISEKDYFKYYSGSPIAYAIEIKKLHIFKQNINPYTQINNFKPPQSFMYYEDEF